LRNLALVSILGPNGLSASNELLAIGCHLKSFQLAVGGMNRDMTLLACKQKDE
jgi:hypothetical protein